MPETTLTKGEQTREQILDAALSLFLQQGYNGTSMRQIAAEAGIALGGIYNHFPSKEELFRQVFLRQHPYQGTLPAILAADGQSPEELVRDLADRMLAALRERPGFLKLMLIEIVEFQSVHMSEVFNIVFPAAFQVIQRLVAEHPGLIRSIPPAVILRTFIGLFFSYYITELTLRSAPDWEANFPQDAINQFVDIYLYGILTGEKA